MGAVVDSVVLEHYPLDGDLGVVRVSSEVEHHLHCCGIDARQVAEVEDVVLESGEVDILGKEEVIVAADIGELQGHRPDVGGGVQDDREVVALG